MKLVQKQFLKGSREFEIIDEAVTVRIRSPFKEEKLTVMLNILNPDPVVNGQFLDFHSRVKCGPLLSLLIDKPDAAAFKTFVEELKQRARDEYNAFVGVNTGATAAGLATNVYEEPPEFDEPANNPGVKKIKPIRVADIETSIQMLKQYLDDDEIKPLLAALEALKAEPGNRSHFSQLVEAFEALGSRQGAVLTYAPYIGILLADDPFGY